MVQAAFTSYHIDPLIETIQEREALLTRLLRGSPLDNHSQHKLQIAQELLIEKKLLSKKQARRITREMAYITFQAQLNDIYFNGDQGPLLHHPNFKLIINPTEVLKVDETILSQLSENAKTLGIKYSKASSTRRTVKQSC
jgi:hypothetical protein